MSINRIDRINELLQREIASSFYHLQTGDRLDLARVTVTRVLCSPDLRKARVMVSVLGDAGEGDEAVRVLNGKRKELQQMLATHVILKYTPHLQFVRDDSTALGGRVLEIMDQLPPPAAEAEDPGHGTESAE